MLYFGTMASKPIPQQLSGKVMAINSGTPQQQGFQAVFYVLNLLDT
jgi:hypothetical protein